MTFDEQLTPESIICKLLLINKFLCSQSNISIPFHISPLFSRISFGNLLWAAKENIYLYLKKEIGETWRAKKLTRQLLQKQELTWLSHMQSIYSQNSAACNLVEERHVKYNSESTKTKWTRFQPSFDSLWLHKCWSSVRLADLIISQLLYHNWEKMPSILIDKWRTKPHSHISKNSSFHPRQKRI